MFGDNFDKLPQRNSAQLVHDLEFRLILPHKYRSNGERKIAQLLNQYRIPFIYEKPVAVQDAGKTKIWYPDFYLFCGVYVEYFGVNGEQSYRERTTHKLRVYAQNGMNVIPVYPQDLDGQWQHRLLGRIDRTLDRVLNEYRIRTAPSHSQSEHSAHEARYLMLR